MSSSLPFTEMRLACLITATVRTGSYLLCEALEETGCAGYPTEAFCPEHRDSYCHQWGLPVEAGFDDYFRTLIEKGTTPNGVFSVKVHAHHVEPLVRECTFTGKPFKVLKHLFPTAKYIHLRRRDVRAQAISYYRADVTNEWWRINGVTNPHVRKNKEAVFDAARILRLEATLRWQEQQWEDYFFAEKIEPLRIEYETLWQNYRSEVARALKFLGQNPKLAAKLPEPRLVRQSDSMTAAWRRQLDEQFPVSEAG